MSYPFHFRSLMNSYRLVRVAVVLCGIVLLAGCGPAEIYVAGDEEDAQQVLKTALEAWKSGKKPADLKNENPVMHIGDEDWQAGKTLKAFTANEEPVEQGGHWRVSAVLTLAADGSEEQKQVAYAVTTEPAITVIRLEDGQ